MAQQASVDAPPMQKQLIYRSSVPGGFRFKPNGRYLVAYYMAPKAFYGRVPDNVVQDAIDEGVDVYGTRPEDLPFWIRHRDQDGQDWGYFFTTAASGGVGGGDFRISVPGGFWKRYDDEEKKYANEDGDVVALRSRFAFYDDEEKGGKLTPWRMKEFRLNEGAAAYRGIAFHPTAKDIAVWKVYNHVESSEEEETPVHYHSSDDDRNITGDEAEEIAVDHPVDGVGAEGAAQL